MPNVTPPWQHDWMETLHIIKITWLSCLKTEAPTHSLSDGKLAKWKRMFTFNTMNYHTINNSRRLHLLVQLVIGNTSDIEKTLDAATLPTPKSGIILLWNSIPCVSFAMDNWHHWAEGWQRGHPIAPGSEELEPAFCSSLLMSPTLGATVIFVGPEQRKTSFAILCRNTFPTLGRKALGWGVSLLQGP